MNIFSGRKVYGGKWSVKSVRKFTPEELNLVSKAQVVESQYGNSACFFMNNGSTIYIPMANDAVSGVGDYLQLSECEVVTLEKLGENDITRIRG